ncbi:hypothetical protein [Halomicrobium urmianum]|uniref:hypothetical protein n=1 Tax=Halomicrobium urmianum TaxID=1586233 RepID=UPI001CD9ED2D|nr:hypothetical protein [Halomicrobium urmianum]
MGEDIYAANGKSADNVETFTNAPASPEPTPVLGIDPTRGQFLRFINSVEKGEQSQGIPFYAKFRDANGDPLPINSKIYVALSLSGSNDKLTVSEEVSNISDWQTLSLKEQRNRDNIDAVKVVLQAPESAPNGGEAIPHLDVRDIDQAYLMMDSDAEIDWTNSEFYIESSAVEQHSR